MGLNTEASAALVYLVLYTILFALMLYGYATRRFTLGSRFTVILFHVMIRLASQATGLAFGVVGYSNTSLLVAYFILGGEFFFFSFLFCSHPLDLRFFSTAEGYFTLIISTYRFLIAWHNDNLAAHDSWLEPRFPPNTPLLTRLLWSCALCGPTRRPMAVIHNLLIGANVNIIVGEHRFHSIIFIFKYIYHSFFSNIYVGGSLLAEGSNFVKDFNSNTLLTVKILRTLAQSVFLSINIFLLYCIVDTIRQARLENPNKRTHPTLLILLAIWPCLFVRGLYGVMSGVLPAFNYFDPNNYGDKGLKDSFLASEYVMGTTMEWVSCTMLMATYITSRNDPKKADLEAEKANKGPLVTEA